MQNAIFAHMLLWHAVNMISIFWLVLSLKRDFYIPVFISLMAQKQISKPFTFFAACEN